MWIEKRGQQHRVYWRNTTDLDGPKKPYEIFPTREHAQMFIALAKMSSLPVARDYVRDPSETKLCHIMGMRAPALSVEARLPEAPSIRASAALAPTATAGTDDPRVTSITVQTLWDHRLESRREVEEIAGLLVRNLHLDAEKPRVDVKLALK